MYSPDKFFWNNVSLGKNFFGSNNILGKNVGITIIVSTKKAKIGNKSFKCVLRK